MIRTILVFGSNLAGRHGAGSAKYALDNWGAIYGQGVGLQGQSYAIPTKDELLNVLSIQRIKKYVDEFLDFSRCNKGFRFKILRVGCGLAGYSDRDIGSLFSTAPDNCELPKEWLKYKDKSL